MKTTVLLISDQFMNSVELEVMNTMPTTCKNPAKCVSCGKIYLSRSSECEVWKKEKEIMKLKVTKHLTSLEARKLCNQQPECTFAKVVQSVSAKPETKNSLHSIQCSRLQNHRKFKSNCRKKPETKYKFSVYIIIKNQCTTAS